MVHVPYEASCVGPVEVLEVDVVEVDEEDVVVAEVIELISEEKLDRSEVRGSEVGSEVLMVGGIEVLADKLLGRLFVVEELLVIATDEDDVDNPVLVARLDAYVIV